MSSRSALALFLLLLATPFEAPLAQTPNTETPIPEAVGFVNDHAGVFDDPTRAKLEAFLDQVETKTGAEFAVLVVPTTGRVEPDAYKVQVFQAWGLGKAGEDNGLLMLVALEQREVRFETGYGLEGVLPDALQSRIFRRSMLPLFRDGDYAAGIIAGVQQCSALIAAEQDVTLEWDGRELRYSGARAGKIPPLAVLVLILVIVVLVAMAAGSSGRPGRRSGWGGGWGGWGGGWGGGFGGGAGRFGGGGGGGSFGGFGGGMSGGGGGGGSW